MWSLLTDSSNRLIEPGDQVDLTGRQAVVLLGSDTSPVIIRQALSSLSSWSLPMLEGELKGAQCVWAAGLTPAGTPAATLMKGERCLATLAMALPEELEALAKMSELKRLPSCYFEGEGERFDAPLVVAPFQGVMEVDGHPRAVASAALTGGAEPMLMIEAADWLTAEARRSGLELYSPEDLRQASSNPEQLKVLIGLMGGMDHQLELQDPATR